MFRFGVPPGAAVPPALESHLAVLGTGRAEVLRCSSYDDLVRAITDGRVDGAWAPPFVCARIEVLGLQVLARSIRQNAATYRAALLVRSTDSVSLETIRGKTAAWVDRDSVAGHLLPVSWLKAQGKDPQRFFAHQHFFGSYREALKAVLDGRAAVTSIFASAPVGNREVVLGLDEVWPEVKEGFRVLGFTADSPNDGVVAGIGLTASRREGLKRLFLTLGETPEGETLLRECFHAEAFEEAPPLSYRALYRLAQVS